MKSCALVLGGYVNGLSIIRELYDNNVKDIWLFDTQKSIATKSNKIKSFKVIDKTAASLLKNIETLKRSYNKIVIYPTHDNHLELLLEIHENIDDYCFLPFNKTNLLKSLNKFHQYEVCKEHSIPFPDTIEISSLSDLNSLESLKLPIIIKPSTREDINMDLFRSLFLDHDSNLEKIVAKLSPFISKGISFIASEYIPGDDANIYAYTAYRSKNGKILNEWSGKKLSQYPDLFGVFSSATNKAPKEVEIQGRLLLNKMNIYGIAQPEFKYDARDNTYKLMEINLRSMMWHRLGTLSGVNLQLTQWNDALKTTQTRYSQNFKDEIHFIYFKHEILNLFFRKKYWNTFKHNIFKGDANYYAIFMLSDLKPFFFDFLATIKSILSRCLSRLKKV